MLLVPQLLAAQDQFVVQSDYLPAPDTVQVFTPSGYTDTTKIPAVYLLHGYSGDFRQWNEIIDLQTLANQFGFILIAPDGLYDSWYINSPQSDSLRYADFFFEDLMPEINHRYAVDAQQTFITGLSMGGHGALYLFSRHPELFKSAASTSGALDLADTGNKYGLPKVLGAVEKDTARWKAHSVIENLDAIASSGKQILFDCGRSDPFYEMNVQLNRKADSLDIEATFVSRPGSHNYKYWEKSLPQHLFFFKSQSNVTDGK